MAHAMRLSVFSLAIGFLFASVLTVPAQERLATKPEDVGVSSSKVSELSSFVQELVDDGKIAGGVTMMARHGKVLHFEAVGMADIGTKEPVKTDSIFRIASMAKPVTTVAVMMLWEKGKLSLDKPVTAMAVLAGLLGNAPLTPRIVAT